MDKYISAEKLKRDLIDNRSFYPAIVAAAIKEAPAEDVAKVVRCRDCKDWRPNIGNATYSPTGHCFCHDIDTLKGDFCSFGERRPDHGK